MHSGLLVMTADMLSNGIDSLIGNTLITQFIMVILEIVAIFAVISVAVIIQVYMERRVCGFIQDRLAPNRVGPFGILQTVADMIKLMSKEDIIPAKAEKMEIHKELKIDC